MDQEAILAPVTNSADLWGNAEFTHRLGELSWMVALPVQLHLNERSTGHPARDWLTAWAPRFMPGQNLDVLVLGCGDGWLERALARQPWIARIAACDFAADAVERARALAPPKVSYGVSDLNVDRIEGAYDVVVAHAVLHHIEKLEHALDEIGRVLKPGGTLIVNEYVGPRRFQYTNEVQDIINALLGALPRYLRRSSMTGRTYVEKLRPTPEEMIRNDPSEAVRSDELLPMIGARFDVLDQRDLGGTLLQHLLYDIVLNFRFEDPLARSLLEMLATFEGALVDDGVIGSDYAIVAARKKGQPVLRERAVVPPPLPAEARAWRAREIAAHPLRRILQSAQLAADPYRPTLNPALYGRGAPDWDFVEAHAGGEPCIEAMLSAMRRVYTPRR